MQLLRIENKNKALGVQNYTGFQDCYYAAIQIGSFLFPCR